MSVPIELAADLMLNVRDAGKAQREIEKVVGGAAVSGLSSAIKTSHKQLRVDYAKALVDAIKVGHKEQAANLRDEFKTRLDNISHQGKAIATLNAAIEKEKDKAAKTRLKDQRSSLEGLIKREQEAMRGIIDDRKNAQQDLVKLYEEGMERAGRKFEDKVQDGAETFTNLVNKGLTLDSLNPDDLIRNLGGALKKNRGSLVSGGKNMMARGAKMGGMGGKGMAMLGRAAAGLGAAAGAIAGVAVAMAAVVAVFAAAYGKVKEWNKKILEGASGFDLLDENTSKLETSLHRMRKAASRVSRSFNVSAEKAFEMTTAFNEAGLTIREMKGWTGATNQVSAMTKAMTFGIATTTALRISADDLATMTNRMYQNFGMNQAAMTDAMAGFGQAAQMSGMNTRSFFAAISEATSGMALYNFRLGDTAELMVGLVKILGEDLAKQTLGMTGGFKNMDIRGKYTKTMTGGAAMSNTLQAGANRQIANRGEQLLAGDFDITKAFKNAGLTDLAGQFDIDKLASLQGFELGQVQAQIAAEINDKGGDGDAAVRSLEDLTQLARVAQGGGSNMDRAMALGAVDRPTEIAATVSSALGVLGVSSFGEVEGSVATMAAFEELTGLQGEQYEVMKEIFNRAGGQMLEQGQTNVNLASVAAAIAEDPGALLTEEDMAKMATTPPGDPMMDMAKQQLVATQTIGDVLGGQISGALNFIGGGVTSMVNSMMDFWGSDTNNKEAMAEAESEQKRLGTSMTDLMSEIRATEQGDMDDDAKATKIASLEARYEQAAVDQEAWQSLSMNVAGGMDVDDARRQRATASLAGAAGDGTEGGQLQAAGSRLEALRAEYGDEKMQEIFGSNVFGATQWDDSGVNARTGQSGSMTFSDMGRKKSRFARADDSANFEGTHIDAFQRVQGHGEAGSIGGNARVWETDSSGDYVYETMGDALENMDPEKMEELLKQIDEQERLAAKKAEEDAALANTAQSATTRSVGDVETAIREMTNTQRASELGGIISRGNSSVSGLSGIMETVSEGGTLTRAQKRELKRAFAASADEAGGTPGTNAEERGILRAVGARDFIYTGGRYGGTITPIDRADDFVGMKPGGAMDRGVGGKSAVIQNLTINESGNAQKTLRMIKQALRAAMGE
jgi:hypothetical protein